MAAQEVAAVMVATANKEAATGGLRKVWDVVASVMPHPEGPAAEEAPGVRVAGPERSQSYSPSQGRFRLRTASQPPAA